MRKKLSEKYNGFHDGIILKNSIDFENKKTELIIENYDFIENRTSKKYKLEFLNVEWQNFEFFNIYNGIFKIDCYKNYENFRNEQTEYLTNMEKYFTAGTFENFEKNALLKYFNLISTTNGLEGFIICENLIISEIE